MTFYYQYGYAEADGWREARQFIDDRLHKGNDLIYAVEAESWKEARRSVGIDADLPYDQDQRATAQ